MRQRRKTEGNASRLEAPCGLVSVTLPLTLHFRFSHKDARRKDVGARERGPCRGQPGLRGPGRAPRRPLVPSEPSCTAALSGAASVFPTEHSTAVPEPGAREPRAGLTPARVSLLRVYAAPRCWVLDADAPRGRGRRQSGGSSAREEPQEPDRPRHRVRVELGLGLGSGSI